MTRSAVVVTEAQLTAKVIDYLKLRHYMVTHFRPARTRDGRIITALQGHAGFPDIVAAKNGEVWFIELKVGRNKLEANQRLWRQHLPEDHYLLVYPEDFEKLTETLK